MNIRPYEVKVVKLCPYCQWRILDKVTPTTGIRSVCIGTDRKGRGG